ncbi:hypothetical protein N7G274_005610 [Stereocaulon virgatum]|uniref:Early meiotic induction protein 1 n=1 Tax=Stereocaulon virgatum TaxID=373712 RepID=A0ABR4AAB0_9LECA
MSWLWDSLKNSSAPTPTPHDQSQPEALSSPPSVAPATPLPNTTTAEPLAVPSDTAPPPSRDQTADAELRAFLESLQEGYASSNSKHPQQTSNPTAETSQSSSTRPSQESDLITPTKIHPSTLSCHTAFDTAFYCASLGGQFTSLYRYGQLRRCSQEWSDFWFCMRTNRGFMSDEERENRIVEWGIKREREKYYKEGKLSSEDVWEARRKTVPRSAMQGDLEAVLEERRREAVGRGEGEGWRPF